MIPKKFLVFLVIAQGLLTFLHLLVYELLTVFFPQMVSHRTAWLSFFILLSLSFLALSILIHNHSNLFLRLGYRLVAIWLVLGFYLTVCLALAAIVYFFLGSHLTALGVSAIVVSLVFTLYGIINARVVRLIEITVKLPKLPEAWKGKTAIMVSDLHLGQVLRKNFAAKIVRLINSHSPHIVLIPGDFYDGVHADLHALAQEFKQLVAPHGAYFASGNHEMFAGYTESEAALKAAGIKILEDEKVEIEGLQLVGLAYKSETPEKVKARLENLSLHPDKPSILLKHVPNHLETIEQAGISLQLSGHTHLGQVWPFRYITAKVFKGYDYGLKVLGKMQIYTSSGIGTWGPPMKVFTKSEMVKITFE